jgi:homoserine kinase
VLSIRIPATTANLGPGFDCMGLALDLWNEFELRLDGPPGEITVETQGEGADILSTNRTNLVAQTMIEETWPGMFPQDTGIRIRCRNDVPCASGLGSSSTATLAGLIFASALSARAMHPDDPERVVQAVQDPANLDRVLQRAIKLEGHGDNVAPALLGGLILVVGSASPVVRRVPFAPLQAVVCVPRYRFLTVEARAALPASYGKADAIHNLGHAMLAVEALRTGDRTLLKQAMADRIHEPYRMPLIPGAGEAKRRAESAGAKAVWLSGAGPGILAVADGNAAQIGEALVSGFASEGLDARAWTLDAIEQGTAITRCE